MLIHKYKFMVCCAAIFFNGCATIIDGRYQDHEITTNREKSNIYLNGNLVGNGRVFVKLERKDKYTIYATSKNCNDLTKVLNPEFNRKTIFSILFLFPGLAADFASGAAWKYDKESALNFTCSAEE